MFLQGNFYHRGKKHRLTLKEDSLSWEPEGMPDLRRNVLSSEVICCWLCPQGALSCYPKSSYDCQTKECPHWKHENGGISIEICTRRNGRKWKPVVYSFMHVAKDVLLAWHSALSTLITGLPDRPRRLLVIINPVGGKRKADSIFEKKISPIFHRAGIHTTKVKTEYQGHGTSLVQEANEDGLLNECDGVIAVGGDGLVSEIATGLFILAAENNGLDPHDAEIELPITGYRLGIIPSGSTDSTCYATHGSNDPITAALHIIMGDKRGVDVAALHTDNQLKRIVTSWVSYGYFGDLLKSSEQFRCLGPSRYILSGVQQVIKNRSYPIRVRVRRNANNTAQYNMSSCSISSSVSCTSTCSVCSYVDDTQHLIRDSSNDEDWIEITGKYSVVSAAISSCACKLTPHGVSPSAHLGDGCADLILVDGSSRWKLLSYLYHTRVTGGAANLNHVQLTRSNEMRFSAAANGITSSWNCDGEQFEALFINIKVHRQKLQLFCRGIEDPFLVSIEKEKFKL